MDAEMDRQGVTTLGINHKGSRYFVPFGAEKSAPLHDFVFSPLMAEICRATIGEDAFLFLDQYVVKAAERGMTFSWHQDEGYIPYDNPPYVGCWCALDDVTEENGTIYVLPYDRAGTKTKVKHVQDKDTNDMVGYFGEDPGIPIIAPAGSIAVFFFDHVPPQRPEPDRQDASHLPGPVFRPADPQAGRQPAPARRTFPEGRRGRNARWGGGGVTR